MKIISKNNKARIIGSSDASAYPVSAFMFHEGMRVTAGGSSQRVHSSNQGYSVWVRQNPPADGDTFTIGFIIAAGTYTFRVLGVMFGNYGIVDWTVDGRPITTGQDWYNATITYNVVKNTTDVMLTDGAHVLQGKVNGKNASSSSYYISLTAYWFE